MHRICSLKPGSYTLLFLLLFPLIACNSGPLGSTPPPDPVCRASATSPNLIDHRYLSSIYMQNETDGWGESYTQKGGVPSGVPTAEPTILHTTDGGCHWTQVKSLKLSMEPSPDILSFYLSANMALVYVNGKSVFTSDGGQSWSSPTLPVETGQQVRPEHLFFQDEHLGWMVAAFSQKGVFQFYDVLRSTDGARSWSRLHASLPIPLGAGNRITSLSFLNETTGWITGTSIDLNGRKHFRLFRTHDGGKSWQEQRLPAPPGYAAAASSLLILGQPHFFSSRDGILPASSPNPPVGISVFLTHDSGQSWKAQPFFALKGTDWVPEGSAPQIPTFTSPSTGWSSIGTGGGRYTEASLSPFHTTNAGGSWQSFKQSLPIHPSDPGFQFITDQVIFALAFTGEAVNFQAPSELYRTKDGGKSWTTLRYTIS